MISGVARIYDINNKDDKSVLNLRSKEVNTTKDNAEMRKVISELKRTIRKHEGDPLLSLAAPEIGYPCRIFCINWQDKEIATYINPQLVGGKGLSLSREKSNVIPGKEFLIPRTSQITVQYETPLGRIEKKEFIGKAASLFQQNFLLLEGVNLADIGLEIHEDFDKATDEEREELISAYLDSLDVARETLKDILDKDEEYKEFMTAVNYEKGIIDGTIKRIPINEPKVEEAAEEDKEEVKPE